MPDAEDKVVKLSVVPREPKEGTSSDREDGIKAIEDAIEWLEAELKDARDETHNKPMRGLVIATRYLNTDNETMFGVNGVRFNLDALESIGLVQTYVRFTQRNLFEEE